MIYWRRYQADYLVKTIGFSMLEDGAYVRLLDHYYTTEKPLPADKSELYDITRATKSEDKKAVEKVLLRKFKLQEDGYHNPRADKEIKASQAAIENGKKGGRPRRGNPE